MFPFDSPENIRKPSIFWCFQGDQKGTLGRKGSSSYAFGNTLSCFGKTVNEVNKMLKSDCNLVISWFHKNRVLLNPGKYNVMCAVSKFENAEFSFDGEVWK